VPPHGKATPLFLRPYGSACKPGRSANGNNNIAGSFENKNDDYAALYAQADTSDGYLFDATSTKRKAVARP
jgi:hypothetical protein